jgi:hypothetical protein
MKIEMEIPKCLMLTMATKMNSNTHKVVIAKYYPPKTIYAVPVDWDVEDITIRYGFVYYKGEEVQLESVELEGDTKYPKTIEESDDFDLEQYFDCEEEDECVSHPPYLCDGGCGKKMGEESNCQRVCDDCENPVDPIQCPISGP